MLGEQETNGVVIGERAVGGGGMAAVDKAEGEADGGDSNERHLPKGSLENDQRSTPRKTFLSLEREGEELRIGLEDGGEE